MTTREIFQTAKGELYEWNFATGQRVRINSIAEGLGGQITPPATNTRQPSPALGPAELELLARIEQRIEALAASPGGLVANAGEWVTYEDPAQPDPFAVNAEAVKAGADLMAINAALMGLAGPAAGEWVTYEDPAQQPAQHGLAVATAGECWEDYPLIS